MHVKYYDSNVNDRETEYTFTNTKQDRILLKAFYRVGTALKQKQVRQKEKKLFFSPIHYYLATHKGVCERVLYATR